MQFEGSRKLSVAVLGAGVAGLAAARRLSELSYHVDVYEKKGYLGGRAHSHQMDGFIFDQGPHVSFSKRPQIQSLFEKAVNGDFLEQDAALLNYWRGHLVRHPAQCNLYGLPINVVERCLVDFVKAQYEDEHPIKTYADRCYKSLGRAFSEEFIFRYTRKYWTTEASNMSVDWLGARVYLPEIEEVVRGALAPQDQRHHYISRFRYPRHGGFGAYVKSVGNGQDVHLCHEVVMVDLQESKLEFANGRKAHFEVLISSLPIPELIRCIKDPPKPVVEAAERLTCTSLVLINLGIEREEGFPDAHWMYFYDEDTAFARGNLPHRLSPNNVPPGCASIQVEIYSSKYRPLPCQDVLNRAIDDMTRIGLLDKEDHIRIAHEQRVPYANVVFDLKRTRNLTIVQGYLDEQGIVCCGRYGEWAYYWTDDSIVSGWRAAERVIAATNT